MGDTNILGFTAGTSLYKTKEYYWLAEDSNNMREQTVIPQINWDPVRICILGCLCLPDQSL
jgi:hypothetical protein